MPEKTQQTQVDHADVSLQWRDETIPVSTRFDDPYFSKVDGLGETRHVFLSGNNLPDRWSENNHFTIAELGFGTGLNFLETARQWQNFAPELAQLHFISFEQYPLIDADIRKALSPWPDVNNEMEILLNKWPDRLNTLDTMFASNIRLSVHTGDANTILPNLNFVADAWYLDGFSPAKNPELWSAELMAIVGLKTAQGGTFATYTVAGWVRRNLQAAGFHVRKVPGFGSKRDMTVGTRL